MRIGVATAAILSLTATVSSAQGLKQTATIQIPDVPINQLGALLIDQRTGLGYLAEKDNKAVVVFDTAANKFVTRVTGLGGRNDKGEIAGPNGLVLVNAGAELWVSDGDSAIRVVDVATNKVVETIPTGGRERANAMAYDPTNGVVIVANSNETIPFLSLISTGKDRRVIARIPVPESAENIERSVFQESSGMFWTAIPVLARDKSKGILAQTNARTGELIALHELSGCHPHSLQLVSDSTIFLGCSDGHGSFPKPGGSLGIFDISQRSLVELREGLGGNGSSIFDGERHRYYHATTSATLLVLDGATGKVLNKLPTWPGSRSVAVRQSNNQVYLATTAKDGPCGGCILVFSGE